jgi:hypothetical protein
MQDWLRRLFTHGPAEEHEPSDHPAFPPEKQGPVRLSRRASQEETQPGDTGETTKGRRTRQAAQRYLSRMQEKINTLAEQFAAGNINRLQFQQLYNHYQQEIQTVEDALQREPESDQWSKVTAEGVSILIRRRYKANVTGFAIYENESGMPIKTLGHFDLDPALVVPMLSSYSTATKEIFGSGVRSTQIEGGQWVCYAAGVKTTLIALFSTEPSEKQIKTLGDVNRVFEQANHLLLENRITDPEAFVYPHEFFLGKDFH